jgi:hypothetical protein
LDVRERERASDSREDDSKIDLREISLEAVDWIRLIQNTV